MKTAARETASQIASKEVAGKDSICDFGKGGIRASKRIFCRKSLLVS